MSVPFAALPEMARALMTLWVYIVLIMVTYNVIRYRQLRRSARRTAVEALWAVALLLLFQAMVDLCADRFDWPLPSAPWLVLLLSLMTFFAALQQVQLGRFQRTSLSAMSLKEAFDGLPSGLCYSLPTGLPRLVNHRMERLCRVITGGPLYDANVFWSAVRDADIAGGAAPVVSLPGGSVFSFRRGTLDCGGVTYYELIATDVTEEYRLTRDLALQRAQAEQVNTRLKALIGSIEYVTMSRELLELKTALHDRLGQSLLMGRRWLAEPEAVDRGELLRLWRDNIGNLLHEGPEAWQSPYYVVGSQAKLLGIELALDGELPREEHLMPVIDTAISVHLTNVLRHAGGTKAAITVRETEDEYILTFTNDGRRPAGPIEERGGLRNLRDEAEALGGRMTVVSIPRFILTLTLPKEVQHAL